MSAEKKKICFYSFLSSGHLNVCVSLGSLILDKYSDKIEIWFIVDNEWKTKLSKKDSRFKFGVIEYEAPDEKRVSYFVQALESSLKMNPLEKNMFMWKMFHQDNEIHLKVDERSRVEICKISPDFLICDQAWHLPGMLKSGVPYAFIASANPTIIDLEEFPMMGSDARSDDREAIEKFRKDFLPVRLEMWQQVSDHFEKLGVKYEKEKITKPLSDHFTLYTYPQEIEYFNEDLKKNYKLWQIDTPLFPERIPKPYTLPEKFSQLPGKIVYVSLGSLFSAYTHLIQRLVNILDKLPYKYIVSKGEGGDRLTFPSEKFIGENYIDQLGVLQVADAMISHGGNNTLGECFYFGVPCMIIPVLGDQINNAVRLEETGYGYQLHVLDYTEDQLVDRLSKILQDEDLRKKWRKASERIQKENRINSIVDKIVDYVYKL